jgi:UTP--glucose-1-phosphate uridylyltransferase
MQYCVPALIGDQPFAVLLPDVLIDEVASDPKQDNLAEMVHLFEEEQISQIVVEAVPESEVDKYGIADIKEALSEGMSLRCRPSSRSRPGMKPRPTWPWSVAMCSRPISGPCWKNPAGAGDEIQLTDAIAMLMEKEQVNAYFMKDAATIAAASSVI